MSTRDNDVTIELTEEMEAALSVAQAMFPGLSQEEILLELIKAGVEDAESDSGADFDRG